MRVKTGLLRIDFKSAEEGSGGIDRAGADTLAPRTILYTGKGGVGKTAAAETPREGS